MALANNHVLKLVLALAVVLTTNACTFRKKDPSEKSEVSQNRTQPLLPQSHQPRKIPESLLDLISTTSVDEFDKEDIDPLIAKIKNLDTPDQNGLTFLELCVRHNQYKVAQRLLAKGANPFTKNLHSQKSLVQVASEMNRQELLKLLVSEQERTFQNWLLTAKLLSLEEINRQISTNVIAIPLESNPEWMEHSKRLMQIGISKAISQSEVNSVLNWISGLEEDDKSSILFNALLNSPMAQNKNFIAALPRGTVLSLLKEGLSDTDFEKSFVQKVDLLELVIEKYKVKYENPSLNQIVRIGDSPSSMATSYMHQVFLFRWSKISPEHEDITRRHLLNLMKIFDPERRISLPGEFIRIRVRPTHSPPREICKIGSEECYRNEIYYLALVRAVQPNLQSSIDSTLKTFEILQLTRHPKSPVRMTSLVANPFFRETQGEGLFWRSRNELFQVGFVPQIQFTNYYEQRKLQIHNLQLNPALIMKIALVNLESKETIEKIISQNFFTASNQVAMAMTWTFEAPLQDLLPKLKLELLEKNCSIEKSAEGPDVHRQSLASCSITTTFTFAELYSEESLEKGLSTQLNLRQTEHEITGEDLLVSLFSKIQIQQIKMNSIRSILPYTKL